MGRRMAAVVLWLLAGWSVGAHLAAYLGISGLLGPILGVAFAAIVGVDPLGILWAPAARGAAAPATPIDAPEPEELAEAA